MSGWMTARLPEPGDAAIADEWIRARGAGVGWLEAMLPPHGVVMLWDGVPVAMAWLILTDCACGVGFIHNVATDPGVPVRIRARALRDGMRLIEQMAGQLGCTVLRGEMSDTTMQRLARRAGWIVGPSELACYKQLDQSSWQ